MIYRSKWNGLTPRQGLELQDELSTPTRLAMTSEAAAWDVYLTYAHRTVALLASNDLMGALDACALAQAALSIHQGQPPSKVVGGRQPVVHQEPPASVAEPSGPPRSSHGTERLRSLG